VQRAAKGIEHRFAHHLRQCRVGEVVGSAGAAVNAPKIRVSTRLETRLSGDNGMPTRKQADVAEGLKANHLLTTLAGGLVKGNPQFRATGGKPVSKRSLLALDWANFFLSDVRDGIGPYLGIYLLARHHWDAGSIGVEMAAMGVATVVAQTPAGALIDATTHKKLLMSGASLIIALSCILMTVFVTLPAVVFFQILMGLAAANCCREQPP
jgi:hypothetical protein